MNDELLFCDKAYFIRGAIYEVYREVGNGFREDPEYWHGTTW